MVASIVRKWGCRASYVDGITDFSSGSSSVIAVIELA